MAASLAEGARLGREFFLIGDMPRIRTLKPEHRQHRKVGKLSDRAYRLWVSMILEADDHGRLVAESEYLRAVTWPYQAPAHTRVKEALDEIAGVGLIHLYRCGDTAYAEFPSWGDHQRVQHPSQSKLPPPDSGILMKPHEASGTFQGEGKGSERKGTELPPPPSPSSAGGWGTPEALLQLWNEATPDECPAVDGLSDGRRGRIRAALKQFPTRDYWQAVMAEFSLSKFLRNLTPRRPGHESFRADFDWLLQRGKDGVENYVKVAEGKYRD